MYYREHIWKGGGGVTHLQLSATIDLIWHTQTTYSSTVFPCYAARILTSRWKYKIILHLPKTRHISQLSPHMLRVKPHKITCRLLNFCLHPLSFHIKKYHEHTLFRISPVDFFDGKLKKTTTDISFTCTESKIGAKIKPCTSLHSAVWRCTAQDRVRVTPQRRAMKSMTIAGLGYTSLKRTN